MTRRYYIYILIFLTVGCAAPSSYDRDYVSRGIRERCDYELGAAAEPGKLNLPEGVLLADGLTPDEAAAIALWNNAQFQADLAGLGFARADLIEAGMLANPVFSLLFPVGPKLLETKLNWPIEALWQRPHRLAAAEFDAQSLSENLIEHGLGLIRDVHITYAELLLAQERIRLAQEDQRLQNQIADLAQRRFQTGDISELESSIAQVDALKAKDAAIRLSNEVTVIRHRLKILLGITSDEVQLNLTPYSGALPIEALIDELLETALAARPDLRAAELSIEAAGERVGWEKSKIFNFIAIIDGKDKGEEALTVGPGFQLEIPLLNQNSGGVARAQAELEQAARQYETVRQNIILQVNQAHAQYVSRRQEYELWRREVTPSLEDAVDRVEKSFAAGEVSYQGVLEAQRKLLEAHGRQAELAAELQRTAAQLNYSIGKKII